MMMAKALASNGTHKVYIIGRRKATLEAAAKESSYGKITSMVGDVTSRLASGLLRDHIKAKIGYINVFTLNSGIGGPAKHQYHAAKLSRGIWGHGVEDGFSGIY